MRRSDGLRSSSEVHYTLRVAAAMCFIGHGAFGIITKKIWLNYFAVFGIGPAMGYHIMPWLGTFDILLGVSLLLYPTRAVLLWLVIWGTITALLRPLSGEPFAEAIERAGNYGAPFVLLMISGLGGAKVKEWFSRVSPEVEIDSRRSAKVTACLRIIVFMVLVGHGWLNLIGKKGLLEQYASLGFRNPVQVAYLAGIFEIIGGFSVLIRPLRPVLVALLVWKVGTELFYPQWEIFEWIERGGTYGSILALWLMLPQASVQAQDIPNRLIKAAKSDARDWYPNRVRTIPITWPTAEQAVRVFPSLGSGLPWHRTVRLASPGVTLLDLTTMLRS